jgi:hypothetical protein
MLRAAGRSINSMRTPRTQRNGPGRGGVGATESTIVCVAFISRVNISATVRPGRTAYGVLALEDEIEKENSETLTS